MTGPEWTAVEVSTDPWTAAPTAAGAWVPLR
jgi:hypothetical protein